MPFDRSKYKKTSLEEIDNSVKAAKATMRSGGVNNSYAKFYAMKDPGKYCFRVMPSITGKTYMACKTVKLPIECPVYDKDGNDTGKKEIKIKDIFTSDIHCDCMQNKDAALIYIDYVYNLASEIQDRDERQKFLTPINGYRGAGGKWVWGISPMLNYVCYIAPFPFLNNDIYRLNLQPKWWERMKEISLEKSSDDVLSIDVFSDPEEGYPLSINYVMENGKRVYTLDAYGLKKGQTWDDFFKETTVPDRMLEALSKLPSLDSLYVNTFTRKDWDMELEGLQRIDEQAGYNIFSDDQFLDELEALEKLVPEKKADPVEKKEEKIVAQPVTKKEEVVAEPKETQYPSLVKMKADLKKYIETEYEGTETLPDLPRKDLCKWYDLMLEGEMLPFPEHEDTTEEEDSLPFDQGADVEEEAQSPVTEEANSAPAALSSRERLKKLREEAAKRK